MNKPLRMSKLRHLVKLYRAEVEGAAAELEALMRDRWDELHLLLGLKLEQVVRLLEREDAVRVLATAIDAAALSIRAARASTCQQAARACAVALGGAAVVGIDKHYCLPIAALRETLELWHGDGDIAFGERGVVGIARLRALLRRCAEVDTITITLTDEHFVVRYRTPRSRGVIRLLLGRKTEHDRVLVVPLPADHCQRPVLCVVAHDETIYTPAPWPADDAQRAASPCPPPPPRRPVLVAVR